jgi:hypothetical protein
MVLKMIRVVPESNTYFNIIAIHMVISNILPSLDTGPINLLSAYFNILFNKNTFRQEYLGK